MLSNVLLRMAMQEYEGMTLEESSSKEIQATFQPILVFDDVSRNKYSRTWVICTVIVQRIGCNDGRTTYLIVWKKWAKKLLAELSLPVTQTTNDATFYLSRS